MKLLKLKRWGPKALWSRFDEVQVAVNARTIIAGFGITINESEKGVQISTSLVQKALTAGVDVASGGSGGTNVDVYGAANGAPVVFHLKQSSPATPV